MHTHIHTYIPPREIFVTVPIEEKKIQKRREISQRFIQPHGWPKIFQRHSHCGRLIPLQRVNLLKVGRRCATPPSLSP